MLIFIAQQSTLKIQTSKYKINRILNKNKLISLRIGEIYGIFGQ